MENKPEEFIKGFCNIPLEFEPGTEMKYSNSGYFLLGYISERISGKTYPELLRERIFKPLGMENSGVDNQYDIYENKAYGYISVGNRLQVAPYVNSSGAYSAGAIYSSWEDLSKWCQSLLQGTLLKRESLEKMTTAYISKYGYGFAVGNFNLNGRNTRLYGTKEKYLAIVPLFIFFQTEMHLSSYWIIIITKSYLLCHERSWI